jgi:hypothetical protein
LEEWAKTISEAGRIQGQMIEAAVKMKEAAGELAKPMREHGKVLAGLAAEQNQLVKHAELVEQNQKALETAYQSYESSLKNLVQTLGDGLGAYLQMHGQTAAQAVNDTLTANIEKIINLSQSKKVNT